MNLLKQSGLGWLWLALLVLVLDQASKQLADAMLEYARPVTLLPVFDLTLLYNKGAAFSFLSDQGGWQRWFFSAVALGVGGYLLYWLSRTPRTQRLLCVSLTLILGGALGNLIDRLLLGHVIDFISLHWQQYYYPAFNIADCAITVGAVLLIWDALFLEQHRPSS
ncbi:signal peptidase II [Motiliproteus sp.]|uniref:signal peptidase II n=1 Tax=Motiliproteus sp. TaxID=1898955 RepID=UPI003BA8E3FD